MGKRKINYVYDYLKQEEVLNKPWLSTKDLMVIIPLGENAINNFRKKICKEMDLNDEFYFKTKPILIPTKKVIEKANIDINFIREQANKIRKGQL